LINKKPLSERLFFGTSLSCSGQGAAVPLRILLGDIAGEGELLRDVPTLVLHLGEELRRGEAGIYRADARARVVERLEAQQPKLTRSRRNCIWRSRASCPPIASRSRKTSARVPTRPRCPRPPTC